MLGRLVVLPLDQQSWTRLGAGWTGAWWALARIVELIMDQQAQARLGTEGLEGCGCWVS